MKEGVIFQTKQLTVHIDRYDHITAKVKGVRTIYRVDEAANFDSLPAHLQSFFLGKRIWSIFHRASSAQGCTNILKKTMQQLADGTEKRENEQKKLEEAKNRLATDSERIPWYDHHWSYPHDEYKGLDFNMILRQRAVESYEQFLTVVPVNLENFLQSDLKKRAAYVVKGVNLLSHSIQELAETLCNLHEIQSANNIHYSLSLKLGWKVEMSTQSYFVESKTKIDLYNPALLDYYIKTVEARILYLSTI